MKISIKDGSVREINKGTTLLEIAKSFGNNFYKDVLIAKVNGKITELTSELNNDCNVEFLTFNSEEGKKVYWHTSAHVLAQAVRRLFPKVKLAIGPAIENGFYYDFDIEEPFTPEMLDAIEKEMKKIVKEDLNIKRFELSRHDSLQLMENESLKQELINDLPIDSVISFYKQGEFVDLCAGPHLPSTGKLKTIKLLSTSGAYWRGNEKNKMLQRIYGISFPKSSQLETYMNMIEEAKKRDHKKLGKQLGLFMISPEGPGFPFFLPKGMVLRNTLENFWREIHADHGYQEIKTPVILNERLWHTSGHWDHYKENMYTTKIDDINFGIKPMNCPGGMLVYKNDMHSYRDLPIRMGELGLVHRHEKSGQLNGLFRVRCFTQDDAHIFCTPNQIETEIVNLIKLINKTYSLFGFSYSVELSTRPENSMGSDESWNMAEEALERALNRENIHYNINQGDGAFYGPKIDFHIKDCLGRQWQCGTIQLDFQMPERFDLTYVAENGEKKRPVMLHRVIFGSIERFIGILIEHFGGAFPVWLAPEQVRILPLSESFIGDAKKLEKELKLSGIERVVVDVKNEKIGYKIREAQLSKIPYMIILGQKEIAENRISVRSRTGGDLGLMDKEDFTKRILNEIENKE